MKYIESSFFSKVFQKLSFFSKKLGVMKSFESLLAPPFCLHCQDILEENVTTLCPVCFESLELLDLKSRCFFCFQEKEGHFCSGKNSFLARQGAVFEYEGAICTFISKLKYGKEEWIANLLAPFLALQYQRLFFPKIDYIIPVPISFKKMWKRGFNQSELLAKELSILIGVPLVMPLFRRSQGFSQASSSLAKRRSLSKEVFYFDKSICLEDKNILLIDDVITTGTTLQKCAEVLSAAYPKGIYSLSLAIASFSA